MLRQMLIAAWDTGLITPDDLRKLQARVKASKSAEAAQALAQYVELRDAFKRHEASALDVVRGYEQVLVTLHASTTELKSFARKLLQSLSE